MICSHLSLIQFKNHEKLQLVINEPVLGISGQNGTGKTNILDAIYYSAYTKSALTRFDYNIPKHGLQGFKVESNWQTNNGVLAIKCILRENLKKEFYCNNIAYTKLSEHIGLLSAVLITPEDIELINADAQVRRKFIDAILCQSNAEYLMAFLQYQKVLQQRNAYLKAQQNNQILLQVLNAQMCNYGNTLYQIRKQFLAQFIPQILSQYKAIALENNEAIQINYKSDLHTETLEQLLTQNHNADFAAGRTTKGPHKDDLELTMHEQAFKNIASQGQKKSMLFALKMAEFYYLKTLKNDYPILLLDDIFEKLDEHRLFNLINALPTENNFQLIATDTSINRLQHLFTTANRNFKNINLPL